MNLMQTWPSGQIPADVLDAPYRHLEEVAVFDRNLDATIRDETFCKVYYNAGMMAEFFLTSLPPGVGSWCDLARRRTLVWATLPIIEYFDTWLNPDTYADALDNEANVVVVDEDDENAQSIYIMANNEDEFEVSRVLGGTPSEGVFYSIQDLLPLFQDIVLTGGKSIFPSTFIGFDGKSIHGIAIEDAELSKNYRMPQ